MWLRAQLTVVLGIVGNAVCGTPNMVKNPGRADNENAFCQQCTTQRNKKDLLYSAKATHSFFPLHLNAPPFFLLQALSNNNERRAAYYLFEQWWNLPYQHQTR